MPTRSFRIRGNFSAPQPATRRTSGTNAPATVLSHRLLTPGRARDGVTGELEVAADEVVRVELDNGFELWTRADALVREHGRRSLARAGGAARCGLRAGEIAADAEAACGHGDSGYALGCC